MMNLPLLLIFLAQSEPCQKGGILLKEVLPGSISHLMTTVGEGVPFIEGADYVSSLEDPRVRWELTEACYSALREAKEQGSLFLQAFVDESRAIESFPFLLQPEDPTSFYHYTDSEELLDAFYGFDGGFLGLSPKGLRDRERAHNLMVNGGRMSSTFRSNRSAKNTMGTFMNKVLFVADDPDSSNIYGAHRLTLRLQPKARVLQRRYDHEKIIKEVQAKFPKVYQACSYTDYMIAFAEGSGIALYDYFGQHNWFTLLSLGFVTGSEVERGVGD